MCGYRNEPQSPDSLRGGLAALAGPLEPEACADRQDNLEGIGVAGASALQNIIR
jgi:hypothetical protein